MTDVRANDPLVGLAIIVKPADTISLGDFFPNVAHEVKLASFIAGTVPPTDPDNPGFGYTINADWRVKWDEGLVWLIYAPAGGMMPDEIDQFLDYYAVGANPTQSVLVLASQADVDGEDPDDRLANVLRYNMDHELPWDTGLDFSDLRVPVRESM